MVTRGGPSCGRDLCMCTHDGPCDRGWMDAPPTTAHQITYERVAPCPVCRPQAADRYARRIAAESRRVR